MAWTSPRTWVTSETVTAALMNTHVRDNLNALNDRAYFVPLTTRLTSTDFDGDSFSTTAKTKIDLSDKFSVPAGIKAISVQITARDSGSSGTLTRFGLAPNNTADSYAVEVYLEGQADDDYRIEAGICPCDANGDVYYQCVASGANTLEAYIRIWGYWI